MSLMENGTIRCKQRLVRREMAETLVAILLVTSSAAGDSLVYRWPPSPHISPRLCRPRLDRSPTAKSPAADDYLWKRSHAGPSHEDENRFDDILGYSSDLLAAMLSPQRTMCHQRFELIVDELAFIGHPVCSEEDGVWRFRTEEKKLDLRGRVSRHLGQEEPSRSNDSPPETTTKPCAWLQTFNLVLVLDRPDPSSTASGNIAKYFDIIYEQIVFIITAVLFQEQVLSNFVEVECDILGEIKDQFIQKGASLSCL
jgi:nitrogen permease regulator 3-like protein